MVPALAVVCTLAAQDPVKPLPPPPVKPLPPPIAQVLPPGIRWSVTLSAPPAHPPLISGDRVFVAVLPSLLVAYDLKDGTELWREPITPEKPLDADAERVYIATGEAVHALRTADHATAWRTPTGPLTAPILAKDGWVIAASDSKLFALRASDGSVVWSRDSTAQRQRAAISGDLLLVPLATGAIRAHDLATGNVRWEVPLAGAPAEPLIVGDRAYLGATDKHFYSVNTTNGEVDWPWKVGALVRGRAASDGERVFYAGLDNLVRAVSRISGSQRWQQGVPFRPFEGPTVLGPSVMIAGPTTDVLLLNIIDGRPAGKISFPEALALAPSVGTSGDAVVIAGITGGLTEAWKLWLATPQTSNKQ
jgi:outer membrane protein assembly factor BamB